MKFRSSWLVSIVSCVGLTATAALADPSDSPLAGSRDLAPVPKNYFAGKPRPVPDLVTRAEIKRNIVSTGIPYEPESYELFEAPAKAARESKERTPSGIWKLSVLYGALKSEYFISHTPQGDLEFFGKGLDRWVRMQPESPTAIIYNSMALLAYAHAAVYVRTTNDAVTPEKLETKLARGKHAEKYLLDHREVGSKDPHWYALVIDAMRIRCAPSVEIEKVLEDGSQHYPDYYQMYFAAINHAADCSASIEAYGAAVKKFVDFGVSKTSETDGTGFYARGYWYASHFDPNGSVASVPQIDWQRMKAGMADVLKRYDEPWNINNFAKFTCLSGDRDLMRELLPRAVSAPVQSVWDTSEFLAACVTAAGLDIPDTN